jgi:hypothetical protein
MQERGNRLLKVETVRCGRDEDRNVARDRHFATHPEDRDANIVIFHFYDEEMADESQDCLTGWAVVRGPLTANAAVTLEAQVTASHPLHGGQL